MAAIAKNMALFCCCSSAGMPIECFTCSSGDLSIEAVRSVALVNDYVPKAPYGSLVTKVAIL